MRLATREEIYQIDTVAARDFGLPSGILVERAGSALAARFEALFQVSAHGQDRIGIWCGPGNNGKDGRVMARVLKEKGYTVEVVEGAGWDPERFDILVDALFGVGLDRDIVGENRQQIEKVNAARKMVVAIDVPSGLDANRGVVLGAAVRADWTLTISPAKPGLFFQQGPEYAGRVRQVEIGFPQELLRKQAHSTFLVGAAGARRLLPARTMTSNKSHFGHLLVIAGSPGMEGAAKMVTEGALRMGCGYVTLCSLSSELYRQAKPDFLRLSLSRFFSHSLSSYSAIVVGPGLGDHPEVQNILEHLLHYSGPVLVDADALNALVKLGPCRLPQTWLLTPHAGELGRLLKKAARELEHDRLGAVRQTVSQFGCQVLFKGFRTVLGTLDKAYVIGSGNVSLAKAGCGDVLAGFIGSLMAQGLSTAEAGVLGAYLHGRIADDWLRRGNSCRTLIASDLPELLNTTLMSLKKVR